MSLTGSQLQRIVEAIRRGYTRDELRRLVRTCLEEDFDALVSDKAYATQVFELVEWANRQGRAANLLRCAYEHNSGNGDLQEVWAEFAPATPVQIPAVQTLRDVFLSYSHHDTELARRLRADLQAGGLSVWTDDGLAPGTQNWQDAIEGAVEGCRCLVVLMTPHAKASRWVRIEVDLAQELGRPVFPLLAAGEKREAVPLSLRDVQYVDARGDYAGAVAGRLLPALRTAVGMSTSPIPPPATGSALEPSQDSVASKPATNVSPSPFHTPPLDIEWITIPAGEFLMGSDRGKDKLARDHETPQHSVYLSEYHIAKYPIINAQYLQFVRTASHKMPGHWRDGEPPAGKANHPVINVGWHDARAYCAWASNVSGRTIRLPSEAEWEKAARGADGRIWPWGDDALDATRCNFGNNVGDTTPVEAYGRGASPYGVLDMVGNVWEWTSTLWGEDWEMPQFKYPYKAADGRERADVPDFTRRRVLRGGAFNLVGAFMRCAARVRDFPNSDVRLYGFRVVLSPFTSDR